MWLYCKKEMKCVSVWRLGPQLGTDQHRRFTPTFWIEATFMTWRSYLYGQAGCGLVGTHMPLRVIANPVAAFLFLTNDLWSTAPQGYSGVPSRVCCGFSIMAHTTQGGGGIYVVLTAADKTCGWLMGLMMMNRWRITFSCFQTGTDMCLKAKLWQFDFLPFFFFLPSP